MTNKNMVKILEVSNISPPSSSHSPSKSSLPLTTFDLLFLKCPPIERLFFYSLTKIDSLFQSILIPNLKHSLSLTLQHFLPLAGNLVWPDHSPLPFILYARNNHDAVSFVVAETDGSDFHRLSSNQPRLIKDSQSLLPNFEYCSSLIPMLAIQVTKFPNHGFCIGFVINHVLVDGPSFNLFLKSWAHICKNINQQLESSSSNLPLELKPSFERPSIHYFPNPSDDDDRNNNFVPKDRNLTTYDWFLKPPANWVRATLELSPTNISQLKKIVLLAEADQSINEKAASSQDDQFHLSTFVVVYAYVLICLIKAKQEEEQCGEYINLTLTMDMRRRVVLSSNYFGNCVVHKGILVEASDFKEELGGGLILKIAKKISYLILEMKRSTNYNINGDHEEVDQILKASDVEQQRCRDSWQRIEFCWVADSPKFKFYEADFGWGNPIKVELVSLGINYICFTEARNGIGGVEVSVVRPNHRQMDLFLSLFAHPLNSQSSL